MRPAAPYFAVPQAVAPRSQGGRQPIATSVFYPEECTRFGRRAVMVIGPGAAVEWGRRRDAATRYDGAVAGRMIIYVDGDACPVKDETYRVAARYAMPVVV